MRWNQTLIPSQKENPADAQIVSHQLMVRAGLIRQLTAGVYDFLPLGLRSLHKVNKIVREELDRIGAAEVLLPALQPLELWQTTGRDAAMGDTLMKLKDRFNRPLALGPTHEEVVTELVKASVSSYKQLPLTLYQLQTKFRDEPRPRFGLMRVREFIMMDAYSFHADTKSLDATYQDMYAAYGRIFSRCGIPFVAVEAESGPIGGSASHEFMTLCDAGEDTVLTSEAGDYSANVEKAEIGERPWTFGGTPTGELEKIHTPNLPSIEEVGKFMKVKPKNLLKTLVFSTGNTGPIIESVVNPRWVVAVVRGDHEVNEAKLRKAAKEIFHVEQLAMEDTPAVRAKWAIGFVGPDEAVKSIDTVVLVDPDAAQGGFWAAGANEVDYHVKHFNWFRECGDKLADPKKVAVADIRNAVAGDPSPKNDGKKLTVSRGIEIGHVFKLGTKYSVPMSAMFDDVSNRQHPMIMGCYGIGVGRILIAAVETMHDDKGIIWPAAIAPYSVVITPIKYEGEMKTQADQLYAAVSGAGVDVLLDDRDARPGVKFNDADLIGIPIRLTIGDRGLKEGKIELKKRTAAEPTMIPIVDAIQQVKFALAP
jgi:prolyl-tRNA synthetase